MTPDDEPLTIVRNDERHRYEARWGTVVVVAFSTFQLHPGQVVLVHTETDPAFEGRGFAGQLARGALDDIRARGETVVPRCPFIRGYIERHPEYADLVTK